MNNNDSNYNPLIHHRRSIRLKGYDYSLPNLFFITVCINNRLCLFGEIVNQQMILNDAGIMIEKWYHELENKFPDIQCGEYVVMPNHFHCVIENTGVINQHSLEYAEKKHEILSEHDGSPLGDILQWFKTMSTNEYIRSVKANGWPRFDRKLWQRNYWEHIIRNENSHKSITAYIAANPANWEGDSINPKNMD